MNSQDLKLLGAPYLYAGLATIFVLSAWAARFGSICRSDGCIGVVFIAGGAIIALLVQILVLIPVFCFRRRGTDVPLGQLAVLWVIGSLAAMLIPFLLAVLLG